MSNADLADDHRNEIRDSLKRQNEIDVGKEDDCRKLVEATLRVLRRGAVEIAASGQRQV